MPFKRPSKPLSWVIYFSLMVKEGKLLNGHLHILSLLMMIVSDCWILNGEGGWWSWPTSTQIFHIIYASNVFPFLWMTLCCLVPSTYIKWLNRLNISTHHWLLMMLPNIVKLTLTRLAQTIVYESSIWPWTQLDIVVIALKNKHSALTHIHVYLSSNPCHLIQWNNKIVQTESPTKHRVTTVQNIFTSLVLSILNPSHFSAHLCSCIFWCLDHQFVSISQSDMTLDILSQKVLLRPGRWIWIKHLPELEW